MSEAYGSLISELDARIGKSASTSQKLYSRLWATEQLTVQVTIRVVVACALSMLLYSCET